MSVFLSLRGGNADAAIQRHDASQWIASHARAMTGGVA